MPFAPRVLGRTGLQVGPLGLGASFGVGGKDLVWAMEHGCNYLYWGSLRRDGFGDGLRELCRTRRQEVVLVIQSYARLGVALRVSLARALKQLGTDYADVLLLGWWDGAPWNNVLEAAKELKRAGSARFIGVSTHDRSRARRYAESPSGPIDVVHVRYNAAHRGAENEVFPYCVPGGPGLVAFTATRWGKLLSPQPGVAKTATAGDCYRFALTQPQVHVCLSGPRSGEDVRAAVSALAKGPMDEEELSWMRRIGDRVYGR